MIPSHLAMVTLRPERQAALQAIAEVEFRREAKKRLPGENPHARLFVKLVTGSSRLTNQSAQQLPGLAWDPSFKLWSLKMLEDALERFLVSRGEYCYSPLSVEMRDCLFPDVAYRMTTRTDRHMHMSVNKSQRLQHRRECQEEMRYQTLVSQARNELALRSPEDVGGWYSRWSDELQERDIDSLFWAWQQRFPSLEELEWHKIAGDPIYRVLRVVQMVVSEMPETAKQADRWKVPNKLVHRLRV